MMKAKPNGKRSIFLFLAFALIHFYGLAQNATAPYRIKTIVIDAGHGGKDPGNLGTGRYKTKEKDIALDVALQVGGYIQKQFPEIRVIYTRDKDIFIGLDGRAEIANDAKADLFLSIHCNAFSNPASNGVETFVLGLHRNKENLEVAMKENSAIFLEDDYKTKYEGFDPNSAESIIALTIMQSAYLQQSLSISSYIQQQFKNRVGRKDRGVKQAGFLVLRKTTMPSILIELGFLTNAVEEDFLNSENGKSFMSSAIFRGFKEYKELVEDPLPEGYSEPVKEKNVAASISANETKAKDEALAAQIEKFKKDSIQKVNDQAKLKHVADSLTQAKQQLLEEKKKREEQESIQAKVDSLERIKQEKIAAFEKREKELEEQRKKELAEKKAKEDADKKALLEKQNKELEAKKTAKEWLEEIKDVKEEELENAKQKVATDEEKERLQVLKEQKEKELEEARIKAGIALEKSQSDSIAARKLIAEQSRIDSIVKARVELENRQSDSLAIQKSKSDSIATVLAKNQQRQEDLRRAEQAEANKLARQKIAQDSIAALRKAEADSIALTINDKKASSTEEAELLFLQLRKKQLEQRIAKLKGQKVEVVTAEKLEERANEQVDVNSKVNQIITPGVVLKVQIISSSKPIESDSPQFKEQQVWQYQQGGLYKYTVGNTQDFEEITKLQGELRGLGFQGAFVVAFKDGERIKVSEARELLNK